jgi:riboflavin kinase/FMN adenylyltransferase
VKIYHKLEDFTPVKHPVVTVGTFDGVHLGHQVIFNRMKKLAHEIGGETIVVTFHPHPRLVVHPDSRDLKFINTQQKKYELIQKAGIEHLIIIEFTMEFSHLSSTGFIKYVLHDVLRAEKLITGFDHHFGKDREGGFETLVEMGKEYGFTVEKVPEQYVHNMSVSSTKIRAALRLGQVALANEMLGYNYSITGRVVPGKKIGRSIGFPTANIELEDHFKLISAVGVYACTVQWKGRHFQGMGNIGYRPTVEDGDLTIEVHIFDFNEEIYDDEITISFIDRIRDEIKFGSLEDLRKQLVNDKKSVLNLLNN